MATVYWTTQSWSDILDYVSTYVPAGEGVIVMLDPANSPYTMDVAANLDRFKFLGMASPPSGFSGYPITLNIVSPCTVDGKLLYLDNVIAMVDNTIWDGAGPFHLRIDGSGAFCPLDDGSPTPIKLAADGVLNVACLDYSLLGGGAVEAVEQSDGSTIHALLAGGSIIGDKCSKLASGASAANADYTADASCVVAGVNGAFGTAFGAGITVDNSKNGNAHLGPYTPATPSDWDSPVPENIGAALDQVAARLRAGSL